jgi:hypothetical protein
MSFWKKLLGIKDSAHQPDLQTPPAPSSTSRAIEETHAPEPAVRLARVVLYQSDEEIQYRLASSQTVLKEYLDRVVNRCDEFFQNQQPQPGRLATLFIALKPPHLRRFWIASEPPGLESRNCHELLSLLEQLPPPLVQHGPLAFALQLNVWNGEGPEDIWPWMPKEWTQATVGRSVRIPDELLEIVWTEEEQPPL